MRGSGDNGGVGTEGRPPSAPTTAALVRFTVYSQRLCEERSADLEANRTLTVLISYGLVWTVTPPLCKESVPTGLSIRSVSEASNAPAGSRNFTSDSFPAHS